jgi:SAM-dependent methyltransferase
LYLSTGQWIHEDITKTLERANVDLSIAYSLLDFASGYGRVTRFWFEQFKPNNLWVADVQHAAVEFLSANLGVHGLYPLYEPSSNLYPRKFDLITVVSLFSHLPQIRTQQWLTSLADALEPGGSMILSFHGVDLLEPALRSSVKGGMLFAPNSESAVLPVFEYGTTYLTHDYLAQLVDGIEGVLLTGIYQRGLCGFQDLAVITRTKRI